MSEVLFFEPVFMERVWGGRRLHNLYQKHLPHGVPIGESWELVDRPEAQSVVHSGLHKGATLHELWSNHRGDLFGAQSMEAGDRFPLLIKLLDANDRLSLQVHPPADKAQALKGEPKTEAWYLLHCESDAILYAGFKEPCSREIFVQALENGAAEELIHQIPVKENDCIFIPSGRVHAIGAGNVIFEVQQNSDTTYRVFDWNRLGLDGQPRVLHVAESLVSMDFGDVAPSVIDRQEEQLVDCPYFRLERWNLSGTRDALGEDDYAVFQVLNGLVEVGGLTAEPGQLFVIPHSSKGLELSASTDSVKLLRVTVP
ncbi:MAG: type I phosphomannose isomerase catalytic subunit [Verrucomicrobiales bacterium]